MRTHSLFLLPLVVAPLTALAQPAAPTAPATPVAPASPEASAPASAPVAVQASTPAATAPASWTLGLAPRLGLVVPTSKLGAMAVGGLEIDVALPVGQRQLYVALDLSLTRPSYDGSVMDPRIPGGAGDYTVKEVEMVVGALVGYRLRPAGAALVPWAVIGPILHLLRTTETSTIAPGHNTATSTELGLEVAAGVDYHAGPGFVVGGLRVVYSSLDHVLTGDTNAGTVGLDLGYRLVF